MLHTEQAADALRSVYFTGVADGIEFGPVERALLAWQYRGALGSMMGDWEHAFWDLLQDSDADQLARFRRGWPVEVEAIHRWRFDREWVGKLKHKLEPLGISL